MEEGFEAESTESPRTDSEASGYGVDTATVRNGLDTICNSIIGYLKRHKLEDFSHTQLARKLGVNKSTIGRHVDRLLERRLVIQEDIHTSKQVRYAGPNIRNTMPFSMPWARSERYRFTAPVHHVGSFPANWHSNRHAKNSKRVVITAGEYIGYTMQLFEGPIKTTLTLTPRKAVKTINPEKTLEQQIASAKAVLSILVEQYDWGIELDMVVSGRPEYAFEKDQYAVGLPKDFKVEVKGVVKIDYSHGEGELEYFGPEYARDYMLSPLRVREISTWVRSLEKKLDESIKSKDKSGWQFKRGVAS